MYNIHETVRRILLAVVAFTSLVPLAGAQTRTEITINDTGVQAENLTSSQDGTVYFGSTAKGTIYRAGPGAAQAEPWIQASTAGLTNVLGVLADDKTSTLWVCQNNTGGRGGAPVVGQTALRSFDLKSGAAKGTYPFPSNGGVCNDMAVAPDGTVYATESFANRIHRLKAGAKELDLWVAADPQLAGVDGIAILADGSVYVNTFFAGRIFRNRACERSHRHCRRGSRSSMCRGSPSPDPNGRHRRHRRPRCRGDAADSAPGSAIRAPA
jgi:hypothetical protein